MTKAERRVKEAVAAMAAAVAGGKNGQKQLEQQRRRRLASHATSDALARLQALGAYLHAFPSAPQSASSLTSSAAVSAEAESARRRGAFCASYGLHEATMERTRLVHGQLLRLLTQRFGSVDKQQQQQQQSKKDGKESSISNTSNANANANATATAQLAPPSGEEEQLLRQVVLSASLDCVARLAPPGTVTAGTRLDRHCAYVSCSPALAGVPLYLHPTSCLFDPAAFSFAANGAAAAGDA
jgi:hypothetical protein